MTQKSRAQKKSHAWMQAHVRDAYVQRARQEGWRARAAFKLQEIDEKVKLLRSGMIVVDLGAAPGSWSQYAAKRVAPGGRVIALDLLPMQPVAGVQVIQNDFCTDAGCAALQTALHGQQADVVLSDMAPNLTGIAVTDQARISALAELALDFCDTHLKPRGDFLIKIFHGSAFDALRRAISQRFASVQLIKPEASRSKSSETYILARQLHGS